MIDREEVIRKVEQHLRKMTRKLIKIDSEEEALQYLSDTFRTQLHCDFVSVVFLEDNKFVPKVWSGKEKKVRDYFPLEVNQCNKDIMIHSLNNVDIHNQNISCDLFNLLQVNNVKTWFTVPIHNEVQHFGFCLIGFFEYVKLLAMKKHFEEFGKDLALAINLTRERETEVKKTEGIEWITHSLSIDSPLHETIREITTRAGRGTHSEFACIYLYNDIENQFILQSPSYGETLINKEILINKNSSLKELFPFLDKPDGNELTTIIAMDIKIIGILHVKNKKRGKFNDEDLRTLQMLSNHVATNLENVRLYNNEKESRDRLHSLLQYQQSLVKETIKQDNFDGITSMVNKMFNEPIVLFDRFMRPLSFKIDHNKQNYIHILREQARMLRESQSVTNYFTLPDQKLTFSLWPVKSGNDSLGYLAVGMSQEELEEYDQLMIEMACNTYAIQFNKQKLVLDTTEQAKESFANKLFKKQISDEDEESILQYANLFMWELYESHRVVFMSINLHEGELKDSNLLDIQMKKENIWDYIKILVIEKQDCMFASVFNDYFLLIVPDYKQEDPFWQKLYNKIENASKQSGINCDIYMGIGSRTENIEDYYISGEQARQALNVVMGGYHSEKYAFFEMLGSYTVLQNLNDHQATDLFIKQQISPLKSHSENNSMNLLDTLRTYLEMNGNANATSEALFLHRSSLLYRLEKIEELLNVKLNDPEVRFNLMLAFKLYDMTD